MYIKLQEQYFKIHGRYAQVPQPTDQKDSLGIKDMRVDVYEGPKGFGFIVIETEANMVKATDYGPEKRSHDWQVTNEF